MDYTNFVKIYYRTVVNKLNHFTNYKGELANLNYEINIPNRYLHSVDNNFDALPSFQLNIDAPVVYFENYLDYLCENTPDLRIIALGKNALRDLYGKTIVLEQNDEKNISKIEAIVNVALDYLKESKVID